MKQPQLHTITTHPRMAVQGKVHAQPCPHRNMRSQPFSWLAARRPHLSHGLVGLVELVLDAGDLLAQALVLALQRAVRRAARRPRLGSRSRGLSSEVRAHGGAAQGRAHAGSEVSHTALCGAPMPHGMPRMPRSLYCQGPGRPGCCSRCRLACVHPHGGAAAAAALTCGGTMPQARGPPPSGLRHRPTGHTWHLRLRVGTLSAKARRASAACGCACRAPIGAAHNALPPCIHPFT